MVDRCGFGPILWHPEGRLIEITREIDTQKLGIARSTRICDVYRERELGGFGGVRINNYSGWCMRFIASP